MANANGRDEKEKSMSQMQNDLRAAVKERFANVAAAPSQEKKFPVGPDSAKALGYGPKEIDGLPTLATESFCGVGNPIGLGEILQGQTVLDLGSGAGLDSLLAARRVGPTGRVVGIDLCAEMVSKARRNAEAFGLHNVEFVDAAVENVQLPDGSVDVVISNGVFNLCLDKPKVLAEAFRVLRPGGRLQMADILLHDDVTPDQVACLGDWSD
jgi:SAM-dependent methyltransferase